ncbi:hypothetical protein MRX96_014705 [Rhipicephalus microplus]
MGEVDCRHPPSDDHPLRHLLPFLLACEARQHGRVVTPTETTGIACSTKTLRSPANRGHTTTVHTATEIWGCGLSSPAIRRSSPSSSAAFPPRPRGQATRASRDPDRDDWHRVFDEDPSIPSQPGPHDHSPPSDRGSSPLSSATFPPRSRGQATRASRNPDRNDGHPVFDEDPFDPQPTGVTRPQFTQRQVSFVELACEQDDYDVTLPRHPSDSNPSPTDQGMLRFLTIHSRVG